MAECSARPFVKRFGRMLLRTAFFVYSEIWVAKYINKLSTSNKAVRIWQNKAFKELQVEK